MIPVFIAGRQSGRPTTVNPKVHRYNFRLTETENVRFEQMLSETGEEHNRSRVIVKQLFAECFEVLKCVPPKTQFIALLTTFIGNIYNQIVKAINAHFSNVAIPLKSPCWNSEHAKGKGR